MMKMTKNANYFRAARENLIWSLQDFADFDRTVAEWRGANPLVRRSYDEDIALFFQTYQAEYFAKTACKELGFNDIQCHAFRQFVELVSRFDEHVRAGQTVDSEAVIEDPAWQEVSSSAAKTLRIFRESGS